MSKVAQSLAFNPHLRTVADRVVDILTRGGRQPFHGVHLRVENDAQDWAVIMGGKGVSEPSGGTVWKYVGPVPAFRPGSVAGGGCGCGCPRT